MARKTATNWRETPEGRASYDSARSRAQAAANQLGYDHGIEPNDVFRTWHVFMLPMRKNRQGHELLCEVVMCENLDRCQPGHGPNA